MRRNPVIAGALSLFVPGLGQIYGGKGNKGTAIIVAAVIDAIVLVKKGTGGSR